jgi:8-oxo-dGTP pyrophosphatase MutT (NUDIX family)
MIKEKSCGAVIYKKEDDYSFLILKHNSGHYSFPKGHVENNESEIDTAIREIKEETNLNVIIDGDFRVVNTYSPKEGIVKDVVFFVAKAISYDVVVQEEEIDSIDWYSYDEALDIITYDSDKKILIDVYKYLQENVRGL